MYHQSVSNFTYFSLCLWSVSFCLCNLVDIKTPHFNSDWYRFYYFSCKTSWWLRWRRTCCSCWRIMLRPFWRRCLTFHVELLRLSRMWSQRSCPLLRIPTLMMTKGYGRNPRESHLFFDEHFICIPWISCTNVADCISWIPWKLVLPSHFI